jgi:hypothetical protein
MADLFEGYPRTTQLSGAAFGVSLSFAILCAFRKDFYFYLFILLFLFYLFIFAEDETVVGVFYNRPSPFQVAQLPSVLEKQTIFLMK